MPRRTLARRFEPRFGVSQVMLDTETKWVGRELEDYLLLSINDLRERLLKQRTSFGTAEEQLAGALNRLPDRERLALKCMLARDVFHIAKLYETFLHASPAVQDASGTSSTMPEEIETDDEPSPVLIFKQSLFEA